MLSPMLNARRVRTDLQTSEPIFVQSAGVTRSRSSSPILPQKNKVNSSNSNIRSHLPARATRLLNRRLQNNNNSPLSQNGSESPRSLDSRNTPSKTSFQDHLKQKQQNHLHSQHLINSSSEDLVILDKSLRNSMLQDVVSFKKQLVHLRRILQEDEEKLMRTDTLNPFETNGPIFNHVNGVNDQTCETAKDKKDDENNVVLTTEQLQMLDDQRQELADLRRQVVYLQSQMDDKDRTIKIQQSLLQTMEHEKVTPQATQPDNRSTETVATQTERLRPLSMGPDNLTSPTEHQQSSPTNSPPSQDKPKQQIPTITIKPSLPKSKTQISSIYTKLSSIKPATTVVPPANKATSIPNFNNFNKTVKTTQIGNGFPSKLAGNLVKSKKVEISPSKKIPQLLKPSNGKISSSLNNSNSSLNSSNNSSESSVENVHANKINELKRHGISKIRVMNGNFAKTIYDD